MGVARHRLRSRLRRSVASPQAAEICSSNDYLSTYTQREAKRSANQSASAAKKRGRKVQRARPPEERGTGQRATHFCLRHYTVHVLVSQYGAVTIRGRAGCGAPLSSFGDSAWERGGALCGTHRCRLGGGSAHRNRLSWPLSCQIRACASVFEFWICCRMLEAVTYACTVIYQSALQVPPQMMMNHN